MNKQSNTYTIVYASAMVILVAAVLAVTSLSLKDKQTRNIEIDKMKQILSSVHIAATADDAQTLYKKYIVDSFVLDDRGGHVDGVDAFAVDVAVQVKLPADRRQLPVFVCRLDNGQQKYIVPMYGAGLWGPIWGYLAVDADGNTVYGAYFAHQGETPGLGAEIETEAFSGQFVGKHLFIAGDFKSVAVEKKGQKPLDGAEYVDAISGGTITSKGVQAMLLNSLEPYRQFFKSLQ
ncbi:MAG: NADH:ubiquinone reductase (Na(+)-transporting) subunit C [Coprobacter sp.]|nr:NADH:ubiquinone reductase (Na(+)-transporting) subunit C [Coprobacter sp.]